MALENLHCPQFVDFTNNATFDMFDGADVYFERGIVGELGLGFDDNVNNKDGIDELIAALNNNTNLNEKKANDKKDSGISEALSISPNQVQIIQNDKNTKKNKIQKSDSNKTKNKPQAYNRTRTNSNTSVTSVGSNTAKVKTQDQKLKEQQQNTQNIVKKTIAKMTAAFKNSTKQTTQAESSNTSQFKLKTKLTNPTRLNDKKKNDPVKVEYQANNNNNSNNKKNELEISSSEQNSTNNRRCSSVPRTLKEKQDLSKQISLGEKIQSFFSRDTYKTLTKTKQKPTIPEVRNQSRSCSRHGSDNEDENGQKERKSRLDDTKNKGTVAKKSNSRGVLNEQKSPNNTTYKPRQRSVDRKDPAPVSLPYQGVKFIPKLAHKYTPVEPFSNNEERSKQTAARKEEKIKKLQEIEMNKTCDRITSTNTSLIDKKPNQRLNNSVNNLKSTNNKENSICLNISSQEQNMSTLQNSLCINDNSKLANTSTISNSSRKNVKPVLLHTEARAHKRHQYDQYLKDKERMAEMIKKNLEMQKMIENKNEIKKLRSQLNFKSKPFKEVKPMEIKPSEKPLTDPKSPEFASKNISSLAMSQSHDDLSSQT